MQINQIFSRQLLFMGPILGVEVFDQHAMGLFFDQSEPVFAIVDQAADGSQDFSQTAGIEDTLHPGAPFDAGLVQTVDVFDCITAAEFDYVGLGGPRRGNYFFPAEKFIEEGLFLGYYRP